MTLLMFTLLALLSSSSIILSYNGVYGGRTTLMTMEKEEDLELERQLKHLNKPAIKSIKMEHGEIYDCVDFYKQPAFDNPLLKNHIPEMSSSVPRETLEEASPGLDPIDYLRLDGGGCPSGTVPIRRTTKEDLIRWKSYSNTSKNFLHFLDEGPRKHFAGYQLKDEGLKYHGGSMGMNIVSPSVNSDNQYSAGVMYAQGGLNHVQVEWHVNPKLYGDRKPHFFGHWTVDGSQKTGCFNALCSGFVQVNHDLPIGMAFPKISTYGGETVDLPVFLFQEKNSKNWWVAAGYNNTNIGYWPRELFNSITESAPIVGWRGEVYAPPGEQSPEMGNGHYPRRPFFGRGYPNPRKTAYFRTVRVYGEDNIGRGPNDDSLQDLTDVKLNS
ncbi:uncharacterized protein LOC122086234 isoform X2 [Macadamia integrifolia]|nr:uncharacterized protein LOC122086234 isoform X2 [Macadamia integrifolia]XP_042510904.1 uncharacterized protein LOC122086234 isoform X2 [Macadamia integrifolia]XP_042510905.1 uncharacterized protein LOC122086234 isoform X2 [Macadamia integrifolia]